MAAQLVDQRPAYIHVADLDASVARAQARGAKLINGPMDVALHGTTAKA